MKVLKQGSCGSEVELVQSIFKKSGYYGGNISQLMNTECLEAVKNFQADHLLMPTGIVDNQTWKELMPEILGYITHALKKDDHIIALAYFYHSSPDLIRQANSDKLGLREGCNITVPLSGSYMITNIRYTYKIMCLMILSLTKRYPFIKCETIGKSVMGKNLFCLKMGFGGRHVMFNASHHGNESITTAVLLKYIEELAEAYIWKSSTGHASALKILRETTIHCIPMLNPDGVDLVNGDISAESVYYRSCLSMNLPDIPFPEGWKANINGTDLNVNYPALWEKAKEIKNSIGVTKPGPREFPGEIPLSEPESTAIAAYTKNIPFDMVIALHTQGQEIYYKFNGCEPISSHKTALAFSEASGYAVVDTPYECSFAGYKDWFISEFNKPGFTIEAGLGTNPLPVSQFDEIYQSVSSILTLACLQRQV